MDGGDLVSAVFGSVVEGVSGDSFRSLVGDQLDRLDDTVDDLHSRSKVKSIHELPLAAESCTHLVLNTTVFTLGVFTDQDGVDVVVSGLVTLNRDTRSNVGEEGECPSQSQVEGDVTLSDCKGVRISQSKGRVLASLLGVAKGPFNATVFFLIDAMASSGMAVLPFFKMGVTSTSSHLMGTYE